MKLSEIAREANKLKDSKNRNINDMLEDLPQEFKKFNDALQKRHGQLPSERTMDYGVIQSEAGTFYLSIISILHRLQVDVDKLPEYAVRTLEDYKKDDYEKRNRSVGPWWDRDD